MKIDSTLDKIQKYLDKNIKYHARGGCGLIAYYVSKELIKRNINFIYQTHSPEIINNGLCTFGHIWIKTGNYIFNKDVEGFYIECDKSYRKNTLFNKLRMSSVYKRQGLWHSLYDTSQNDKMRRAIKYYFKQYDNNKSYN